ncbi:MAG TPA: hypothetical protein PKD48_15625 [Sphingopyxis sp.]|nr:hypothetical protein [Sphingopyxis sp.]
MLITSLVLAAAAAVQSPAAKVDATRAAFTKCLRDDLKKSLEKKMTDAEYEMAVKSVCGPEREAFHAAVVAFGRSAGDSQKNAQEDADIQVEDYHANFTDKFKDYSATNTIPGD